MPVRAFLRPLASVRPCAKTARRTHLTLWNLEDRTVPSAVAGPIRPELLARDSAFVGIANEGVSNSQSSDAPFTAFGPAAGSSASTSEDFPAVTVKIAGVSLSKFNPLTKKVIVKLKGDKLDAVFGDVQVSRNGFFLGTDTWKIKGAKLVIENGLTSGRNVFSVDGYTKSGQHIQTSFTVWAGDIKLTVETRDEAGNLVKKKTKVSLGVSDSQSVFAVKSTSGGKAVFKNVPNWTVLAEASSMVWHGEGGGTALSQTIVITVSKMSEVSDVENLNFAAGLDGWNTVGGVVSIVDGGGPGPRPSFANNNLLLTTSGEGPATTTHTFEVPAGKTSVKVRYRFITSEVPGGYYGTQYNDWFSVGLRSSKSGQEGQPLAMNSLPLSAFDANGATAWKEVKLDVNKDGDTVEVKAAVANVGDGALDSSVEIDLVKEEDSSIKFTALKWDDKNGGLQLKYEVIKDVEDDTPIDIYFASGTAAENKLGTSLFSVTVPAGTKKGVKKTVQVPGTNLNTDAPTGTTHLIAVCDETNSKGIQDVQIDSGANADMSVLTEKSKTLVRNLLRYSGEARGTITSTLRDAEDQARAMHQNLMKNATTLEKIQDNIQSQLDLYGPVGDQVIQTFVDGIDGMTFDEVVAASGTLRDSMETKVQELLDAGETVSKHCVPLSEYNALNVLDIAAGSFTSNKQLFITAATAALGGSPNFIDESDLINHAFHLQISQ